MKYLDTQSLADVIGCISQESFWHSHYVMFDRSFVKLEPKLS